MPETGMRGDSALLLASARLVEAGITLLKPVSECLTFDLVVFNGVSFDRIQVKRAYPINLPSPSKFKISLRRVSMTSLGAVARKYSEKDTDFIIGVVVETGDLYCLPISMVAERNSLTLNPYNIVSKNITNKKRIDAEPYKNVITLHNKIYKL
jgi:hypothetical protein